MDLFLDGDGTLQGQLIRALRRNLTDRATRPGERIPGTRALASELSLSRTTVLLAVDQLIAEGYLESRPGAGTFIRVPAQSPPRPGPSRGTPATPPRVSRTGRSLAREVATLAKRQNPKAAGPRPPLDFRYSVGRPQDFPMATWRRALGAATRSVEAHGFRYPPIAGSPSLRRALAGYLRRARGLDVSEDDLMIVGGSQQALDLATRVLLDPGDAAVLENPHYPAARLALRARGIKIIAIPAGDEGLDTTKLGPRAGRAKLVHLTPSHQFPLGGVMPLGSRLALLAWARKRNAVIFEDDYNSEFRLDGRALEPLVNLDTDGRVLYTGTFSKTLFPSLRLGFMIVPRGLRQAFFAAKLLADQGTALLEQEALARFIDEGSFERHVRRVRRNQRERRGRLLDELAGQFADRVRVHGRAGGLHVVLELRGRSPREVPGIVERARKAGVGVYDLAPYFHGKPRFAGLLLGTAALDGREISLGIRQLGTALRGEKT